MQTDPNEAPPSKRLGDVLKEYELLRAEIADNSRLTATVFIANTTVTAAILGFGFSRSPAVGAVFLAPLAILVPSLFFIASQLEQTTIISQYLRVFLEPQLGVRWQTNWFALRKYKLLPRRRKYAPAVSGLYGSLCVLCLLIAALTWEPADWRLYIFVAILTGTPIITAVMAIRKAFSAPYRREVAKKWRDLKQLQAGERYSDDDDISDGGAQD